MPPKISVIIPIYNVEKYLDRCLNSVLNQTLKNFEIICVNDGSMDNCGKILETHSTKDKRIKIITQENQGLSMARNNGLKKAAGEYIYFLDSDDAIQPQTLEIVYKLATDHSADIVSFEYTHSDGVDYSPIKFDIKKIKSKITTNPLFQGIHGKYRISFNVWSKLYKRNILDGIEFIPNIHFEDYPHTYAVMSRHPKTVIINTPLHIYTKNNESISSQKANPKQIKDYHIGLRYLINIYQNAGLVKEFNYIKKELIPNILKQQLKRCQKADKSDQEEMWFAFKEELLDLEKCGCLDWKGHKLSRYLAYRKLIKKW